MDELWNHYLAHHPSETKYSEPSSRPVQCLNCPLIHSSTSNLRNHIQKQHTEDGSRRQLMKCSYCDYQTTDHDSMYAHHFENHEGKLLPFCIFCSAHFNNPSVAVSKHLLGVHSIKRGDIRCKICNAEFMSPEELQHYKATETFHKPKSEATQCLIFNKWLSRQDRLKII